MIGPDRGRQTGWHHAQGDVDLLQLRQVHPLGAEADELEVAVLPPQSRQVTALEAAQRVPTYPGNEEIVETAQALPELGDDLGGKQGNHCR